MKTDGLFMPKQIVCYSGTDGLFVVNRPSVSEK